jgi:uncharacterized membrane protein
MNGVRQVLYEHIPHHHKARNANEVHAQERQSINDRIAVAVTKIVGTMQTAYTFVVLAFIGLIAILGWLNPLIALLVAWLSQTFIQLVLLPVIMVGQNVSGRHQEITVEEEYQTSIKICHDIEQIAKHQNAQDAQSIEIVEKLDKILVHLNI